jgi:hypothetical protein
MVKGKPEAINGLVRTGHITNPLYFTLLFSRMIGVGGSCNVIGRA